MIKKFVAEMVGTFIFLGVIIVTVSGNSSTIYERAEAWIKIGLALSIAILLLGKISGGHFNPAVSFMFYLNNNLSKKDLLLYIIAQLVGATIALLFYKLFYK